MSEIYVIDTCALIDFYGDLFNQESRLSGRAKEIISSSLSSREKDIHLSIPSVVFVEIYCKWLRSEEFARKFYSTVYRRCLESPNIEIKPIDQETLENMINIRRNLVNHEIHDKIILASAMSLNCPLISFDVEIKTFVQETNAIPSVIN